MNYMGRHKNKRKQNNKAIIGIIIAIGITISIYLLSIIPVPYLSSLSAKIIYCIDAVYLPHLHSSPLLFYIKLFLSE